MSSRLAHVFGHLHVLQDRQRYARDSFQNLYTEIFKEESKLSHCMSRLDRGSEYFCDSLAAGVDGLKVILTLDESYYSFLL